MSFAIPQFVISNFINPWIVDIGASLISMGCLILFLKVWQPRELWLSPALRGRDESAATMAAPKPMDKTPLTQAQLWSALLPWIIVCVVMLIWGNGAFKTWANSIFVWNYQVPELRQHDQQGAAGGAKADAGTRRVRLHLAVVHRLRHADRGDHLRLPDGLLAGQDDCGVWPHHQAVRDLADHDLGDAGDRHADPAVRASTRRSVSRFAATGVLYPFFGTLLGWLGVALTGSDTASNVLFGNLQKITSEQLGLSPILMAAANSSGGVMGKMIDAQSIVVASTATNWYGHEGYDPALRVPAFDRAGVPWSAFW